MYELLDEKLESMPYQYDGHEGKIQKGLKNQTELRAQSDLEN